MGIYSIGVVSHSQGKQLGCVVDRRARSSVAVKADGVDGGGDGPATVAPSLLLGLLVAERLSLCEP